MGGFLHLLLKSCARDLMPTCKIPPGLEGRMLHWQWVLIEGTLYECIYMVF